SRAAKEGEPTIADPEATSAPQLVRHTTNLALGVPDTPGGSVSAEPVKGTPGASEPPPRSDSGTTTELAPSNGGAQPAPKGQGGGSTAIPELVLNGNGNKSQPAPAANSVPSSNSAVPTPNAAAPAAGTDQNSAAPAAGDQNGSAPAANANGSTTQPA